MRLTEYLKDIDEVKNLKIGLVKKDAKYQDFIQNLKEKYDLKRDIIKEIDDFNKEFRKIYKGQFKFDFCISEDINIDDLKVKNSNKKAAKSFRARHKCSQKKDRTTAGYWSCNVGRYAKQLGLSSSNSW
jgi:hypothetical protein